MTTLIVTQPDYDKLRSDIQQARMVVGRLKFRTEDRVIRREIEEAYMRLGRAIAHINIAQGELNETIQEDANG